MKSVLLFSVLALLLVEALLKGLGLGLSSAKPLRYVERFRTISRIAFAIQRVLSDSLTARKGSCLEALAR